MTREELTFTAQLVRQQFAPLCRDIIFAAGYIKATNPQMTDSLLSELWKFEAFIKGGAYTLAQKDESND